MTTEAAAIADSEIAAVKWDWPNRTFRQNGQVVDSPRDIIDTGYLRDSYQLDLQTSGDRVKGEVTWTAPYAVDVHNGTPDKPARPFTHAAITRQAVSDFAAFLRRELR